MSDCNHENYFMNENCYVCDLESEIQQLEARLKDAEKVIGFYADVDKWYSYESSRNTHCCFHADFDYTGDTAREYKSKYKVGDDE